MAIDCSCAVISHDQYRQTARNLSTDIEAARSFGAAAGMVFRETHAADAPRACQSCFPHIGQAIVDENLRPAEEFAQWKSRLRAGKGKDCGSCESQLCKVTFDLSPL